METKPYKNWWFLACNGIFAILIGFMLVFFTTDVIHAVIKYFGYAIGALGLILLVVAILQVKKDKNAGMMIFLSICCLFVGVGILILGEKTLNLIFILIGIWAVIVGIFQLVVLVNVKRNLSNKNVILFNGLLTIALGVVMFFNPEGFSHLLLQFVGICAFLFGIVMIYLSLIIRKASMIASKETDDLPPAA
jgi:uncharacterized membrane protein HdeD (DUF308 family)